ncbi:helix-turn-helix transcriptional regulator [Nocardiopsis sp. NPDC007018]|uniref:helix-turn-helix domain-containing protein n=1 Tax=Nocardiopsis sp. NPDC007018 TaxID=3155721 RepID=UPI0033ED523C
MTQDTSVADRLIELRRKRGLTQEALAEAAEISVGVVRKLEQGGTARIENYHRLGRVLGVRTVWFMSPENPTPRADDQRDPVLADIRSAVNPPLGLRGRIYPDDDTPPSLELLGRAVESVAAHYQADRYDDVARMSPALVRSAHAHVAILEGDEKSEALRLRADALQLTARYLIQIREHDLSLIALRDALTDALSIGDQALAAACIGEQGWALLRQGRFDDVERLCADTADVLEPSKLSKAPKATVAAWGYILMRAGAAAVRNNRPVEAREYQQLAQSAGEIVGDEIPTAGHMRFGRTTALMNGMQNELVSGRPDVALSMVDEIRPRQGQATENTQQRYALDQASAHLRLRNVERTTEIMMGLKSKAPTWFRQQQAARDITEDLLEQAKRMPSSEHREIAEFLGVTG